VSRRPAERTGAALRAWGRRARPVSGGTPAVGKAGEAGSRSAASSRACRRGSTSRAAARFSHNASTAAKPTAQHGSGLLCLKWGERIDLFKRGGGAGLAEQMEVPFLGRIPVDTEVVMTGDAGVPLCHDGPQSLAAMAFSDIIQSILDRDVQQEFGGFRTGVSLHYETVPPDAPVPHEMRLCEAVARSFLHPIVLPVQKTGCPGARRAFGLLDDDLALAGRMSEKAGVPFDTLRKALAETPCLAAPPAAVRLDPTTISPTSSGTFNPKRR
jgi:hypothetical protein